MLLRALSLIDSKFQANMYCCDAMKGLIDEAGRRGMSVIVCLADRGFRFSLQMRAVTAADEIKLVNGKLSITSFPEYMTLSSSMVIHYCPSCGKSLNKLVVKNPAFFKKLADEHQKFHQDLF